MGFKEIERRTFTLCSFPDIISKRYAMNQSFSPHRRLMSMRNRYIRQICVSLSLLLINSFALGATRCEELFSNPSQKLPKIDPIILKPLDRLFDDPNYQFEMKYDGFRGVGYFESGGSRFISRQGNHLSQFQSLCETIWSELKVQSAIFDGEIISVDPAGRPIFNKLLRRKGPFKYVAFDLLWLDGQDLRSLPLRERRRLLLEVLPESSKFIIEPLVTVGSGSELYNLMVEHDLEGIVVKRLDAPYSRSTRWSKFKNRNYSQAIGRSRFFR